MKSLLLFFFCSFCISALASDIPFEQLIKENNRAQRGLASEVQKGSGIEHKQTADAPEELNNEDIHMRIKMKKGSRKKRAPSSTGRYRIPL